MDKNRKTSHILNIFQYDADGHVVLPASLTLSIAPGASDNNSKVPTTAWVRTYVSGLTYATQSYVNTQVANLVASSPATLDTLNELAAALGNDPNFATTVATSIGTKQAQLNGTGFVKVTGTTVSYDNSTYLTTSSAASTYQTILTNPVTGTGTSGYVPKFTGASTIGSSLIYDTNSVVLIGATTSSGDTQTKLELINNGPVGLKIKSSAVNGNNTFLSIESSKEWRFVTNRGDLISGNQGDLIIRNNTDAVNAIILNQSGAVTFNGLATFYNPNSYSDQARFGGGANNRYLYTYVDNSGVGLATATNFGGESIYFNPVSNYIDFSISSSSKMKLVTGGGLEIGYYSIQNTHKLDVNGTARVSGAATFSSSITAYGSITVINGIYTLPALTPSYFGYSGYGVLIVGNSNSAQTRSIAFNVDVSGNPSGAFSGYGNEYIWRNAGSFITPNSINNGYNTLLSWNSSGQITFNQAATFSSSITTSGNINVNSDGIFINRSTSGEPYIFFRKDGVNRASIYGVTGGGLRIFDQSDNQVLTITGTRLGISDPSPSRKLTVNFGTSVNDGLMVYGSQRLNTVFQSTGEHCFIYMDSNHANTFLPRLHLQRSSTTYGVVGLERASNSDGIGVYAESEMVVGTTTTVPFSIQTNSQRRIRVASGGGVEIFNTLSVSGNLTARNFSKFIKTWAPSGGTGSYTTNTYNWADELASVAGNFDSGGYYKGFIRSGNGAHYNGYHFDILVGSIGYGSNSLQFKVQNITPAHAAWVGGCGPTPFGTVDNTIFEHRNNPCGEYLELFITKLGG